MRGYTTRRFGPLAQLVEQGTLNPKVEGSIPSRPTPDLRVSQNVATQNPISGDVDAHRQASWETADAGVRFLAEAGEVLAESLDWEATLVRVAQLAVPMLGDWCIVDVLEGDGETVRQVAVSAITREKEDLLREMRMLYPPTIDSPQPAARALRSGEPVIFPAFDPESLATTTRDGRHFELMTSSPQVGRRLAAGRARPDSRRTDAGVVGVRARIRPAGAGARDRAGDPCRACGRQRDPLRPRAPGARRGGRGGRAATRSRGHLGGRSQPPRSRRPAGKPPRWGPQGDACGHGCRAVARRGERGARRPLGARPRGGGRGGSACSARPRVRRARRRGAPGDLHPRREPGGPCQPHARRKGAPLAARGALGRRRTAARSPAHWHDAVPRLRRAGRADAAATGRPGVARD